MSELTLRPAEQELALAEAEAVLAAVAAPEYRAELVLLVEAIAAGRLGDDQAASLDRILELALQAGRIRAVYGPPGEQTALRLYRRLPRGTALTESARAVSEALGSLRGHPLEEATLTAVGPGSYSLALSAGEARLSIRLDRQGARLASVEV